MAHYMQVSTQIYDIYLKYIAPEDIHVYSIDEVLIDVTGYLQTYRLSAYDLAMKMILDVVRTTGITATALDLISIWPRWRWTSGPSTFSPMKMGCASPALMK